MYRLILLDADDTLFDYKAAEKNSLLSAFELYGIKATESTCQQFKKINSSLWSEMETGKLTKEVFRIQRFKDLFEIIKLDLDPVEFNEEYLNLLSKDVTLMAYVEELCKFLNNRYRLVVLTNGFKEVQESRIRNSLISDYIDKVIVSEEAGVNKPHGDIFRYALKVTNHQDLNTVLMIGNSLSSDIKGGNDFGIDTCWLNMNADYGNDDIKPTYEVNSILEILKFL